MRATRRPSDVHLHSASVVIAELHAVADPSRLPSMAHVGIPIERALGVSIPTLRRLARRIGPDHRLAGELWVGGIHEARMLASMIDEPQRVTSTQMERWVREFDSWDVCDQVCGNLFSRTSLAYPKAFEWSSRRREFVKRAAFALLAGLGLHDKAAGDEPFLRSLVQHA